MHPPEPQNQKLQSSTLPGAKPCAASCSHTASNALLARTGAFTSPVHASKQLSSSFHLPKSAALHMMHFASLFYNSKYSSQTSEDPSCLDAQVPN